MEMITNIGKNIKQDLKPVFKGKYGLLSSPMKHIAGMYVLGLSTMLLGSVILGAVSKELND